MNKIYKSDKNVWCQSRENVMVESYANQYKQ